MSELALLRGVSRSFYLSIRLLPAALRAPVAVGYLLARAADTLADTPALPARERLDLLDALAAAVESGSPAGLAQIAAGFAPRQHNEAERQLVLALPGCIAGLNALGEFDQHEVRKVLRHITRGQRLDLLRFPGTLQTREEIDEYTWLVAGSVGEFWTNLGFHHLPGFARLPRERMAELGRGYGMGLQLVNILRDESEDLAAGRGYLPPGAARADWIALARTRLDMGCDYALALESARVRAATALPALLGVRTLALMEGGASAQARAKVPRREVRAVLARMALTFAARAPLAAQYARLRDNPGR